MNIEKEIFYLFSENKDNFTLYHKVLEIIFKYTNEIKGKENGIFYEHLSKILNSINNAGYEKRRSSDIDFIRSIQSVIVDKYEEYLP